MKLCLSVLVFTLTYVVYHLTLFPSVSGGDSGELMAEACHLGTAHPPGYPLFTILSHLSISSYFDGLPRFFLNRSTGDLEIDSNPTTGWRMNNLTAVFAALASVFIALTCFEMLIAHNNAISSMFTFLPSAIAALLFAFSPLVWEHSVGAEVFSLNNFFCSVIVYLTVKVIIGVNTSDILRQAGQGLDKDKGESSPTSEGMNSSYVLLGAFVCGLALSNQHASLLLIVVAVPVVLLTTTTSTLGLFELFLQAAMFGLGLISYNYLFLASINPKPGSWGDLCNIWGLLGHVLRTEYGTFSLGMTLGSENFMDRMLIYFVHLFDDGYFHLAFLFGLIGICQFMSDHNAFQTLHSYVTKKKRATAPKKAIHDKKVISSNKRRKGVKQTPDKSTAKKQNDTIRGTVSSKNSESGTNTGNKGSGPVIDVNSSDNTTSLKTELQLLKNNDCVDETVKAKQSKSVSSCDGVVNRPLSTHSRKGSYWSFIFLAFSWMFYLVIWNAVLSNIPLSAPMPYGVHARFWMQPNITFYIFVGLGMSSVTTFVSERWCSTNGSKNQNSNLLFTAFDWLLQCSVIIVVYGLLLRSRFDVMDKSQDGWIMHEYGNFILQSVSTHSDSLLLSHTDLNWNTIRYLQVCERVKTKEYNHSGRTVSTIPDATVQNTQVVHLSFQLMPYPWFPKQQAPLYPDVKFPPMFAGVTTQRMTTENAYLVDRFLTANIDAVVGESYSNNNGAIWGAKRPIFLDMQSINDLHIDAGGTWRNFTLIPWGMVYLVLEKLPIEDLSMFHSPSLQVLNILRKKFFPLIHENSINLNSNYNITNFFTDGNIMPRPESQSEVAITSLIPRNKIPFLKKFPPGSWEHAAVSSFHDSHNQLALNILSYAMEIQKTVKRHGDLLLMVDRLFVAADLLLSTINSIENLVESNSGSSGISFSSQSYSEGYAPLSTPFVHLLKNCALSLMRLESLLGVAVKFQAQMQDLVRSQDTTAVMFQQQLLLDGEYLTSKITDQELTSIRRIAIESIQTFLGVAGDDKDVPSFRKSLSNLLS